MNCEYCKREFSTKGVLVYHQKTAKYCLKIQNKLEDTAQNYSCNGCGKKFTIKFNFERHLKSCNIITVNKIKEDYEQKLKEQKEGYEQKLEEQKEGYEQKLKEQKEGYEQKLKEQKEDCEQKLKEQKEGYEQKLKEQKECYKQKLKEQQEDYEQKLKEQEEYYEKKKLKDKISDQGLELKELKQKIENMAFKSTTTNNKTQIVNNYIQNLKPLTEEHLAECSKHLTLEQIKRGASGYAEYALNYPFKDTVLCVDYSRHKIKMKDKDGHIITDPEMLTSSKMFFKSIFSRNKQLLQEYSNEKDDVINKHGQDYADKLAFELLHYIADVSRGMEGEQSELQRDFVKEICSKKTV